MKIMLAAFAALLLTTLALGQDVTQNKPMEPGVRYTIHADQGLTVELGPDDTEVFRADNGLHVIGHANQIGRFTCEIVDEGSLRFTPRSRAALYDSYFVPAGNVPAGMDLLAALDKIPGDHKPYTPGTGGQGRGYVSPAGLVLATPLSEDNSAPWVLRRKALRVLREWCIEELESRPLSHVPFVHHGDRYSRREVNLGTPREWHHQRQNEWGWNAFDTAHMYLCHAYTLAAYGDPLGTLMVALVHRWAVPSAYPGVCTNWLTQPRGQGWVFELAGWASVLDLWPDEAARERFLCGLTLEDCARGWLAMSAAEHWERAGLGDNHNSPMQEAQARGHLGFHRAIRLWGLARLIRSDLPRDLRNQARALYDEESRYMAQRGISDDLMSRVVGTYLFADRVEAEEWARTITLSGRNTWEAFEAPDSPLDKLPAGWYVREAPRASDTEMLIAALVVIGRDAEMAARWMRRTDTARWTYDLVTASVLPVEAVR